MCRTMGQKGGGAPTALGVEEVNGSIRGRGGTDWRRKRRGWGKGSEATPLRTSANQASGAKAGED